VFEKFVNLEEQENEGATDAFRPTSAVWKLPTFVSCLTVGSSAVILNLPALINVFKMCLSGP